MKTASPAGSRFTDDLPSKSQIFEYWRERLPPLGFRIDWGEPGCWACGFHYGAKYDVKRPDARWCEISLGGTNDVANLFLMCRECHDLAPNTSVLEIFFEWARAQSWHTR